MADNDKSLWDAFKDGFKPVGARADEQVKKNREQRGQDMLKKSPIYDDAIPRQNFIKKLIK